MEIDILAFGDESDGKKNEENATSDCDHECESVNIENDDGSC